LGFAARLQQAVVRAGNAILVGIDPRLDQLPEGYRDRFGPPADLVADARCFEAFSRDVLDVLAPRVPAVKFQAAFFEALGPAGLAALDAAARHARSLGLVVILDGKRNDIGSTAEAYADAYLTSDASAPDRPAPWTADALTVTPYLGTDGIAPFVDRASRHGNGLFVLVRTSNPSAREFQDLVCDGRPLYRHVAERLAGWASGHFDASGYSAVGAVVGATYPRELAELREALPGILFLVPGYGAQGGTAADIAPAFDDNGFGALVNNSRGLTFAYRRHQFRDRFGADWQRAIERAADEMRADLASHVPRPRRPD
jgi:orotidine-5'-phosphate decarboxylase